MTIAPAAPDIEAPYHALVEILAPAERAELARLLLADGAQWSDYYRFGE
jgi:hypothetical protein